MKKITTLLAAALCVFAFSTQAQYIVSSNINAGVNPGNLNNDNEYPVGGGLPAGWATLFTGSVNTSTTPSWTANQTIPFSFQFDSTAVTSYKVSTNGVVTFDVASTVNPTSTNANLPSTSIPDNSVVIWGLFAGGTGDYIISKTFGTAPNRQHWIMFNSYSTLGAGWAYWSVVLEETSNNIYVVDQRTNTGPNTLTVGVQIDTATAFVVPGSPNITSNTTNGPTPADNSYYQFTPGTPPSLDAEIASINVASKVLVNTNTTISADIRNLGTTTLTSVEFHYRINNGAIQSDTIALNLAYAAQATINHTIQWNPSSTSASNTIEAWLEAPNNGVDQVPSNDTLNLEVAVGNGNTVAKTALFEQFTTAVCQFCPDGAWVAGQMESNYANVATVSIHSCFSTDQMTNQEAVDLCATLGVNAAPTGMVDRKLFPSESDVAFGRGAGYPNWTASTWASRSLSQANAGSPVDVVVGGIYDPVTRNITVNVTASFTDFTEPGGDLGISLMIVEDSVIGSGTGYDQINAYNTSTGHPFAGRGNPITNYPHRRVMRDILPSTFGDVAAIPANCDFDWYSV